MIRLLFAFEDCPSSQVASLLAARMKGLLADDKASAEFVFPRERGARSLLIAHGPVHLEPDPRRLKKLVAARGYDAVITIDAENYLDALAENTGRTNGTKFGTNTSSNAMSAGTGTHPPVIAELRQASDAMLERLERKALRGVVVASERQKLRVLEQLHGELRARVEITPDSADPERFHPSIPGEPGARPILVFRGELEEKDNWSTFLEVGALVAIRAPELELWMLGGEDAPEELALAMMETAESLGVLKKLRWFPGLDHAAVAKVYAHAGRSGGALVITRRNETSGQVALEALLAGCPVITSSPSAACELPDVKQFHGEELHEAERAVFEVLQDTNRRLRRAILTGREALIARSDPPATGAAYLKTILKLIGRE